MKALYDIIGSKLVSEISIASLCFRAFRLFFSVFVFSNKVPSKLMSKSVQLMGGGWVTYSLVNCSVTQFVL